MKFKTGEIIEVSADGYLWKKAEFVGIHSSVVVAAYINDEDRYCFDRFTFSKKSQRVLVRGDEIHVSDYSIPGKNQALAIFHGMYEKTFVSSCPDGELHLWKYAIHVNDVGE